MLTKCMPGIGNGEPHQVASIVIMNKTYARIRFVDKTDAKNRLC